MSFRTYSYCCAEGILIGKGLLDEIEAMSRAVNADETIFSTYQGQERVAHEVAVTLETRDWQSKEQVRTGEGVFGLRRAFLNAGAKTVIMSLMKVPDRETKDLMVEFYKRGLTTGNKVKALHEAQLVLMRKRRKAHGAAHPLFWGAFIAMGDPR